MLAHAPGDVGDDDVSVVEFDPEHGIGQGLENLAFHFDLFVLCHNSCTDY